MHVHYTVKYDVGNCNVGRSATKGQRHVMEFHSARTVVTTNTLLLMLTDILPVSLLTLCCVQFSHEQCKRVETIRLQTHTVEVIQQLAGVSL